MERRSPTVAYFGIHTIQDAIAHWFNQNGITVEARDQLVAMTCNSEDDFFQVVCDFVEKRG